MTYIPLSPEAAANKIKKLFQMKGLLNTSELVFFGGMTDAAVKRGLNYLKEKDDELVRINNINKESLFTVQQSVPSNLKVGLVPLIENRDIYEEALNFLQDLFTWISEPDSNFNQNFVTPDTSVRRILYASTRDDLNGKNLFFLGDDDLTSVVAAKLYPQSKIFVLDIDEELLSSINSCAERYGLSNLNTILYNAFDPLPNVLYNKANIVWCDPSKDVLDVFLRNASLLMEKDGTLYTFAQPEYLPVKSNFFDSMLKYKLIATDIIPRFNQYCSGGQFSRKEAISNNFQLAFTESLVRLIKLPN